MADEPENPDAAADRLEAALERIARAAAVPAGRRDNEAADPDEPSLSVREIAEQLDALIDRLRAAVGAESPVPKQ